MPNDNSDQDMDLEEDNANLDLTEAGGESDNDAAAIAAHKAEVESEARIHGWRPMDSGYKGDPAKFVDAETFLARGKTFNKTLQKDVEVLKAQVAEAAKTNKQLSDFYKDAMARKEKEFDDQIKELRIQKSAATREGEDEDAVILEDRIEVLREQKAALKKDETAERNPKELSDASKVDPVLTSWIEDDNEWFRDDPKLRAYAMAIGEELRENEKGLSGRVFLDRVRVQMEKEFPSKFQKTNPNRSRPGITEGGAGGMAAPAGRTERDLPLEDRQLMRRFVADGLMTKEQYLTNYNWSKK